MFKGTNQQELLAEVAHLYFETGSNQDLIARRLNISRPSVSRLLRRARQEGIVKIQIEYPLATCPDTEQRFVDRFHLKQAHILKTTNVRTDAVLNRVCLLTARFLQDHINDGDTVAVSWGSTLYQVAQSLTPVPRIDVSVVQLIGTRDAFDFQTDQATILRRFAQMLGAKYINLNAPWIVESHETQRALLREPAIRRVLEIARKANLALVGIGALANPAATSLRRDYLADADLELLRAQSAVGDVCSQYFDRNGKLVAPAFNERVIALNLNVLHRIPVVIGVAVGAHKAAAILGALRGNFINVLITDDMTAERVMDADRRFPIAD